MSIRKIKLELIIDSNKKTCGKCKHRIFGFCQLFGSHVHFSSGKDYKRLDKCIGAEAKYKNGDGNAQNNSI